jgi:hypothetical protein
MKSLKRFLLWVTVLTILFFITASAYVTIYGKSLVERALNEALKRNVILGSASYHFPLGLQVYNVWIARSVEGGEFLKIKKVVAQVSLKAIYHKRLAFDWVVLVDPLLIMEQTKPSESKTDGQARRGVVVPSIQPAVAVEDKAPAADRKHNNGGLTIERLMVKRGRVHYVNRLTEKGVSFNLEDVQLKTGRLVFPVEPNQCKFHLSARLIKEGNPLSGSHVKSSGWIDAVKKDMEAAVEVIEEDGAVGMTANAVSRSNEMDVSGEIKLKNFLQGLKDKSSSESSTVNDLILNALTSAGVEIGAKFSFKTNMDNFQLRQVSFSGTMVTK